MYVLRRWLRFFLSIISLDVRPMIEAVDFHATAWMQIFAHHLRSTAAAKIAKISSKIKVLYSHIFSITWYV